MDEEDDDDRTPEEGSREGEDRDGEGPFLSNDQELTQPDPIELANEADELAGELEEVAEEAIPSQSEGIEADPEIPTGELDAPPEEEIESNEGHITQVAPEELQESDGEEYADEAASIATELEGAAEEVAPSPTARQKRSASRASAEQFGTMLEQFNAAGGIRSGSDGFGDTDGEDGDMSQFASSVVSHASKQDEMLIEHARTLDDMTRRLELERL